MNYTENYHLPQWEETDRIRMDDFNDAMSKLEEGLSEHTQTLATPLYVTGRYTGTTTSQSIDVGFHPQAVVIAQANPSSSTAEAGIGRTTLITRESGGQANITSSGFTVRNAYAYPSVNINQRGYVYLAFR